MRALASIKVIDAIEPIEGADAIEVAIIGGWSVVVKKGEFLPGMHGIYFEIDSWIPHELAPFLTKSGHYPKIYDGVEGQRLKTIRLRGQLSQGLLLPVEYVPGAMTVRVNGDPIMVHEDQDVTELLGIKKWEAPIKPELAGISRGNFPSQIPKTDQERIQNLKKELEMWKEKEFEWEVTEKLEGSSMTVALIDGEFVVCSRNINLQEVEGNTFWAVARNLNLEEKMREQFGDNFAIQGELVGPGIQDNIYGLKNHEFYVYDIYDIKAGKYLLPLDRRSVTSKMGIYHVPFLDVFEMGENVTIDGLLKLADGASVLGSQPLREGIVFKSLEYQSSFKVISNEYLLKQK